MMINNQQEKEAVEGSEGKKYTTRRKRRNIKQQPAYVTCPICHIGYKCDICSDVLVEGVKDGMTRVLLNPTCGHKFLVFIDNNLRVRATERVDHEAKISEVADVEFLQQHLKELQEEHKQASGSNYNEAFELMKKIKKVKKQIASLKNNLVVK